MTVTLPLVLILAAIVAALLKFRAVGFGAAVLVMLFGFYLAGTDAAPSITQFVTAVGDAFGDTHN
ncbi:hypothetical protein H181DRAFT_00450 [Streptomyces sp. WMMB 714]|jgi:hypothetical protein|uniref:hypothetical protein n=1 Tax=Streptomyces sp. WMMB 714 TaxID=1286822 RepID=UPI0005F79E72|nr:hypothetical protein [Streptomyces sp. WMMB 714]OEV31524.1 hypothetical protein AN219_04625 [Streptomyces nanshensis]SCK09280.1 hypothetical protein H181DRAFT_00450 [Streptomyces sp. WMMB 714]